MQCICARSPIALDEQAIIRDILLDLNDDAAENALVAAQRQTLSHFYELLKALEMHRTDRGQSGSRRRGTIGSSEVTPSYIPCRCVRDGRAW